ncbi:MAG: helix-turn-helix domain-containing protein [Parvibaculaceae bacterium]|nr:helix-turn-helix domain-containing protein [Kangiella sp.]
MKTASYTSCETRAGSGASGVANPCADCDVRSRAICDVLDNAELTELSRVNRRRELDAGDCIFFEGDPTDAYYVVIDGSLKLYKLLPDGRRQVTGFLFKGDFLGLAEFAGEHTLTAEALEPVEVCQMPREKFDLFTTDSQPLSKKLLQLATRGIVSAQEQMLLLGRKTAQERLASFLLWMSARAEERGDDPDRLSVPMSRTDMGDYLGLTVETVSRTITKLKTSGVISLADKGIIEIKDHDRLEDLSAG